MITLKKLTFFFIVTCITFSCKKEEETTQQESDNESLAGYTSSNNSNQFNFSPDTLIKGERIGVDTNYTYNDSTEFLIKNDPVNSIYIQYKKTYFEPYCNCNTIDCCMPS